MRNLLINRSGLLRAPLATVVVFLILFVSCDNRTEALELAKEGRSTALAIVKFYDSLIQDTRDTWELEVFLLNSNITESEDDELVLSETQKGLLRTRMEEIQKRAKLARTLAATYTALEKFASYDARGEIEGSVTNLASSISGLGVIPLPTAEGNKIDPSKIFGMIAGDIAAWKQSKDLREGSVLIEATIRKTQVLFYLEKAAYQYIASERGRKIKRSLTQCIKKKNCSSSPLKSYLIQMNLNPDDVDKASEDRQTMFGILGIVTTRNEEISRKYVSAADGIDQSLNGLAENHQKFQNKEGLSLGEIKQGIERASEYLKAIEEIRKGKKGE